MNKPLKYFLIIAWFVGLLLIAWLLNGCCSRQFVILPDPYQQNIDRQIALRQLRQAEAQERQVDSIKTSRGAGKTGKTSKDAGAR